jgi:hypothetical protein
MLRLALGLLVLVAAGPPSRADDVAPPETFTTDQRDHWAFQPIARPTPPAVKEAGWPRNPIDAFLLAAIEEMEFSHAPEADRVALIRRVTFDLTGLPPTPEEVDRFTHDPSPIAFENLVDRLLASPHYGERQAQHWLDLAHYAESNGFELDAERPDAWRYRDWVVNALNTDMPYDRFVTLQIAGDEAEPGDHDALIATGFGRSGPREVVSGNIDPAVRRQSELTEITGTVGSVFLGLTMACARCHDHKFDALPTTDYYRLQAFFAGANLVDVPIASKAEQEAHDAAKKAVAEKVAPLRAKMAELEAPYRKELSEQKHAMLTEAERSVMAVPADQRTPVQKKMAEGVKKALEIHWEEVAAIVSRNPADQAERERLKRAIHEVEITLPRPPARAMAVIDQKPQAPETVVYRRGDPKNHGPKVAPRPPGIVLASMGEAAFSTSFEPTEATPGRRIALARWLTRPDNPLTARVIVNRLWQYHFGQGIVASSSDFGVRGEAPSHPELLDWLASELIREGWRLKPIHRLIVTSATYRQASAYRNVQQAADDPENTLVWRQNRRRLDAEGLRDSLLAVTGEINDKAAGPGVLVPIEKEVEDLIFTEAEVVDLWPETADPAEHARRSLYLFRKRNVRYPMFDAFDAPDTQTACARRPVSTHSLQALVLLNSRFAIDRARALAGRVLIERDSTDARIDRAYRLVLGRPPAVAERDRSRSFLETQSALLRDRLVAGGTLARPMPPGCIGCGIDAPEGAAWVDLALALLNCNEFLFVP